MNRVILSAMVGLCVSLIASQASAGDDPPSKPKVWAIVVGIDRYEDASIPRCEGAVRDARAIAEWLSGPAGWGESQILRMDDLGRKTHGPAAENVVNLLPTKANLDWALVEWLGRRVRKDDIVVLYFAGQATSRAPRSSAAAGRSYVLPIDARAANFDETGWSIDEALDRAQFLAVRKARVVLWLDTSPSGRGKKGVPAPNSSPVGQDWLRALTRWPGVTAWLAADRGPASEGGAGSPGPFVSALLKALGTRESAHNLIGCLKSLNEDPELVGRGFQTMGGVGPAVSLWAGGAEVVEEAVPELILQSGHGDRVTSVVVTADNAHAVTASEDSTVRVWSLADRSLLRVLTDPLVGVEALALNRDGTFLMAGDGVGRIFGWDMKLDRPRPFYGPPEHLEGIQDIAFLPGGKRFVTRDRARRSFLWDVGQGAIQKIRAFSEESITHLASALAPEVGGVALAASVEPRTIVIFDGSGQTMSRLEWKGGRITSLALSQNGTSLVAADTSGKVVVYDVPGWKIVSSCEVDGKVELARFSSSGFLLIADSRSLQWVEPRAGARPTILTDSAGQSVGGEIDRVTFSNDGRWLAACTPTEGRVLLWKLGEGGKVEPIGVPAGSSQGLSLAFSSDSRTLLCGDSDGGLRSWTLPDPSKPGSAESRPSIPPARGKVASLVPSPSGRYLLQITKDDVALIWDLKEGRGCKPLPGSWMGGAFLPDESKLLLVNRPDQGGDVVVFDRMSSQVIPPRFERSAGKAGGPNLAAYDKVIGSKSGKRVVTASLVGQEPLACVRSVETGKVEHSIRDHDGGLTAVDLSGDESLVLTASEDGTVKLWRTADAEIELRKPQAVLTNPDGEAPAITSAKFCPSRPDRIVVGTRGGFVFLWEWKQAKGKWERVDLGRMDGEINAAAFSVDGRWVVASSSRDKSIRSWSIPEVGSPTFVPFKPRPNHAEQVGSLISWPNGTMIVSGGDDAAIRFWDLKDHALVGTLVAQTRDAQNAEWLAYTPEGLFDGSLPGEAMVKWRLGARVVTLQQSQDVHHVFQLAGAFPIGERIKTPELKENSPELRIDTPGVDRVVQDRSVDLTVWSGDSDPSSLRLYQNGVPIKGSDDFAAGDAPHCFKTQVTLRTGDNIFYAMGSKLGTVDGQSGTRTIRYDGPELPGRVHTLAIGVSHYQKRPLKYAHVDAQSIAMFLESRQVRGKNEPGERVVLLDQDVTVAGIENGFRRIRDAVKGRPQDTVVLFLAGHTDTDRRNEQFCLLLPDFPFVEPVAPDPTELENPLRVATRGNVGGSSFKTTVGDPGVLPYVMLYNRLARLEALQRLIIVDACQAKAILDDPAVRNIQRLVEKGSRSARNSYLLAARRGEPATEADALKHGLLTYTLLHGLRAPGLEPVPAALGGFPGKMSADANLDGIVTSDELARYADETLPRLSALFPSIVQRAANDLPAPVLLPNAGAPELEGRGRIQSSETSFPLIELPR